MNSNNRNLYKFTVKLMSSQIPQLMITEQPMDEYQDFISHSLSDVCFSVSKFQSKGNNVSENSLDQDYQQHMNSNPLSPNNINITKPSNDSSDQKQITQMQQRPSVQRLSGQFAISSTQERIYKDFFQYFLMQKFVHRISFKKKLNSMFDKYHFDVINDLGATFNLNLFRENTIKMRPIIVKQVQKIENRCFIKFNQFRSLFLLKWNFFINKIPLIYPESKLKMLWDAIVTLARFYFIYVIPMDLAWEMQSFMFDILIVPTSLMLTLLIIDFILSFNNAYYEFGSIVTDRRKIAQYVFTKTYGLDILSVLVLISFLIISVVQSQQVRLTENWYHLLLLLFLIQYKNISKLSEQVEEALNLSKQVSSLLELGKLIFLLFFVLHIFSCLWFWVGSYSYKNDHKTWLNLKNLEEADWNIQYLYSFYFSTVTMFTVGYGDITPQSTFETVLCIMFMMICSIQLSYSVSTVSAIIDKISFYSKEKRKKVQTINTYIISQLLLVMYNQIFKQFAYNQQEETEEEKNIINQLSENLRESLQFEANSMILNNCPLFKNHFSVQLKKKLVKKIKSIVVQPENIIDFDHLFPSQKMNQFICFVEEGEIQIFIENEMLQNHVSYNSISIVNTVSKGSSLGLMSFITGIKARERFKSIGFSKLLLLSRDDFLKIIPEFPEDYEVFREMHDDLIYNSDSEFLKLGCFSCKSVSHKVIDCPLVHFILQIHCNFENNNINSLIPDKEFLVKKHQFSKDQKRNEMCKFKFKRNQRRSHNYFQAFNDLDLIQETSDLFQADNYKQCLFYEELDDDVEKLKIQQINVPRPSCYFLQDSIKEEPEEDVFMPMNFLNQRKSQINKITKKSMSLLVDDDLMPLQHFRGINKFKRAVEIVKSLNKVINRKSLKAQTKNILASLSNENYKDSEQKQLLNSIKKRLKYIEDHNIEWRESDIQEMEFLKMRLQMLIQLNAQKPEKFDQIESVKQYKFYNIHNNVDQILTIYNEFYKVKLKEQQNIPQVFKQFVKYLMYPYSFIHKYKFKSDNFNMREIKQEEANQQKKKNQFSKLLTLHKQSKNLRKKLNVKKAQIQPL